jgi:hypothetical protein
MTMMLEPMAATVGSRDVDEQVEMDPAWAATVARRLREIETGQVKLVSGRETSAIIDAMIGNWPQSA